MCCSMQHYPYPCLRVNPSRISARTAKNCNFKNFNQICNEIQFNQLQNPMLPFRFQFDRMVNFLHSSVILKLG
jgi:hypothetical protein